LLFALLTATAAAFETFVIEDIRVEGLRRISAGTVFNYLPIKVGETMTQNKSADAIRALYKTGFFNDVRLERDGNVLVVFVNERPSIDSIVITGNKDLETEELLASLKQVGFAEGRVFDRAMLDRVELELKRLYFSQGKYAVKVSTSVSPLERNRVAVNIEISEGAVARIHEINIVGNNVFDDDDLLDELELSSPTMISFITGSDKYSRQKLAADLERIRSYYQNRGYVNFNVDSTQVSITPDKQDVYITINITEGEQFIVREVKLAGELVVPKEQIFEKIQIRPGDVFSRGESTRTNNSISQMLGNEGYAFANVNVIPDIDKEKKQVDLTFYIDPGKRVYVRRISFTGNTKTRDEVLRREMRQMEGAWASTEKIELSKARLKRLGYFEDVTLETKAVPGTTDQVDVNANVIETPSGNLLAGVGYSRDEGVVVNASVTQRNFLGTGKDVGISFNTSTTNTVYGFSYTNPYYTIDGVSRGFNIRYSKVDAEEADIGSYVTDIITAGMNYGIPITEFDRAFVNFHFDNRTIKDSCNAAFPQTPIEYCNWLTDNGREFNTFNISASLSHDTRNSAVFADRGSYQRLSGDLAVGDVQFYKLEYQHIHYIPLTSDLTLQLKGEIAYGESFGETTKLPFFENYLGGGVRSVRGFAANTIGPKSTGPDTGRPIGGNFKAVGNVDLIFPMPLIKDKKAWRLSTFFDVGNVCDFDSEGCGGSFRYSVGAGVTWISPFGALTGLVAAPFNAEKDDTTENFQFTFGSPSF